MLHQHRVGTVDVFLVCDHRGNGRVAEKAVFRRLPREVSHGIELAIGHGAADKTVTRGFFKHYSLSLAEEFDEIGCASLARLVFGLEFCKLTRASFVDIRCGIGLNARNILLAYTR